MNHHTRERVRKRNTFWLPALGLLAQAWASSAFKEKRRREGINATTYNTRLVVSPLSFYQKKLTFVKAKVLP
jgi:hypothetical protein